MLLLPPPRPSESDMAHFRGMKEFLSALEMPEEESKNVARHLFAYNLINSIPKHNRQSAVKNTEWFGEYVKMKINEGREGRRGMSLPYQY